MINKFRSLPIGLFAIVILLSACIPVTQPLVTAGSSTQGVASGTQVTIKIWHQWTGDTLKTVQSLLHQYMTAHPGVSIELLTPESIEDALKIAIPAGEGPDIIEWTNDQIGSQATVGNIIDLGKLEVTQNFLHDTYEPAAGKGMLWQGKIWALPESQSGIALVYNKALVDEANLPADPMDFSDLLSKAKAYAEANPGKYLVCNQGLGNSDAYYVSPIYFGFGIPQYVDETGKVYLNTPEGINAGNWIQEFSQYAPSQTSTDICTSDFTEGIVAADWTGPWDLAGFKKAGIDIGIVPMGKPFVAIRSLMIGRNAEERGTAQTALDIIKYLTNQANEVKLASINQLVPANTAALNDPQIKAVANIKEFGIALHSGVPMETTPYAAAQWGPVGDATLAIWNGSQSVEDALAAGQKAIENAIIGMK